MPGLRTLSAGLRTGRITATGLVEAALERTRLRAPFDGTIAEVNGELGEYVTPSPVGIPTPPAVDIIDSGCLYISAPIDEVDAPWIREGMPARISLDAFGTRAFDGRVRRVAPYVQDSEKQARTVQVEVDFHGGGEPEHMLPGYTADVEIVLETRDDVLRIPTQALLDGNRVYVHDPDQGTVALVEVSTGLQNWRDTEILTGLEVGWQIVTSIDAEGLENAASVVPVVDD